MVMTVLILSIPVIYYFNLGMLYLFVALGAVIFVNAWFHNERSQQGTTKEEIKEQDMEKLNM
jgi:uncharacterized membrane protein